MPFIQTHLFSQEFYNTVAGGMEGVLANPTHMVTYSSQPDLKVAGVTGPELDISNVILLFESLDSKDASKTKSSTESV